MATEGERTSDSTKNSSGPTITEAIRVLAAKNARAELDNEVQLKLFLQSWWSSLYNRPLKDPLLQTYTLEELLYEFYDKIERRAAELERQVGDVNQQEEAKEKEDLDWAEKMEREELELEHLKEKAATEKAARKTDPTKDPENVKWMEEQMRIAKTQYGETFGEDIDEKFDGK